MILDTEKDFVITTVFDVLASGLDVQRDRLLPSTRFDEELGAEDLDFQEILQRVESKLQIIYPDPPPAQILTIGEWIIFLADLKQISGMREYLDQKYPGEMRLSDEHRRNLKDKLDAAGPLLRFWWRFRG